MKVGIMALPQSGRKTVFTLLTGDAAAAARPEGKDAITGIAPVLDPRFDRLVAMYHPKKETRARTTVELIPPLEENTVKEGAVFRDIAGTDALCLVARDFLDESIYHVKGSVDALRDIDAVMGELLLHDLLLIEKRLERIAEGKKRSRDERAEKEEPVLIRLRDHLEKDQPLRTMELSDEERKLLVGYSFITMKEMIVVLNTGENALADDARAAAVRERYAASAISVVKLSARLEAEIAALDSADEREAFMKEAGIAETALSLLTRTLLASLGLISFFTVGEDEVRQWMIRKGALAPEAAGAIHSDIQRGFIRAEVIKFGDLLSHGSEDAVKKAGKHLLMGKDYLVEDGDIVNFRFNV